MNRALRILHLEGDPKDAGIVQSVLETGGIVCEVTRVDTQDDFIASLERGGFELILADFFLPSFDGLSALKLSRERRPDVPFIFVSRAPGEEVAIDALKIGATDFVVKGRLSRIVSSVHRALREAGDRAEREQAGQQLRRSEAALAEGQRISHTGSWSWIISSGTVTWSDEQYRMLGFEPGTQQPSVDLFLSVVHPEDRARIRQVLEEATRTGQSYEIDYRVVRSDGVVRQMRSVSRPVPSTTGKIDEYIGVTMDTTERVRAEEGLRQSEERFALAVAGANEGIFDWDLVQDQVYVSHRAQELFGLPPGDLWRPRRDWRHILDFHPDDAKHQRDRIKAHIAGGVPMYDVEFRIIMPDGSHRWFRQRGIALRDGSGKAYRMVGSIGDITERKRAEEEVLLQKAHLDHLFDMAPDAVILTTLRDVRNLRVNKEFTRMFGYTAEEAVGRRARDLIAPPELKPANLTQNPDLLAGRTVEQEVVRQRKDGTRFNATVTAKRVRFGNNDDAAFVIYRDITERKRGEKALRLSEERYAGAMEVTQEGHWDWDVTTDDMFVSGRMRQILGFAPEEVYSKRAELIAHIPYHTEDRERVATTFDASLAGTENRHELECRVVLPAGNVRWLQFRWMIFRNAEGAPVRVIGVTTDITGRRTAEEGMEQLEERLRQAQRLEAMGTLAGGIAHDFNNILGAILGYGEMALRDAPPGTRLRRDLDSILAAGERGRTLIDRILTFSRSGVVERIPVHVEKVVREALDLLVPQVPGGIVVEPKLEAGRAAMQGDPTQVHQVLMNLATNAIQAMPTGGTLSVSLRAQIVDEKRVATTGTVAAGEYIVLEVVDSGTGIAPAILDRIFDPFFTTKEVNVGTGLGLSLVHGIVAEVGGAIDVASTRGSGSTFTVYLPRAGDVSDELEDPEEVLPQGGGQRVMVVDDEESLVRLATETLGELGYEPSGFTSSIAALDAFRAAPEAFDAVVTDERMPGMSGSALIREVRRIRQSIPILLVSGYVGGMVASRAYNEGANEVLKKPLSAHELATSLARVLRV